MCDVGIARHLVSQRALARARQASHKDQSVHGLAIWKDSGLPVESRMPVKELASRVCPLW